jgi:hypothetical protein
MPVAADTQSGVAGTDEAGEGGLAERIAALRAAYADETGHPKVDERRFWRGSAFDRAAFDEALGAWGMAKHELWQRLGALEDAAAQETDG